MPNIIYQKSPGQLIAQGNRTVSTFPSGLIRVDQSFICATADAASQRALLPVESNFPGGNDPAIDGIYVYPDVQEKRQSDGFTELIVSGYGRTQTTLQNQQKRVNTIQNEITSPDAPGMTQNIFVSRNLVSGYIVIEKNSGLDVNDLGFAQDFFNPFNIVSTNSLIQTRIVSIVTESTSLLFVDWNGDIKNRYLTNIYLQFSNTAGVFNNDTYNYYFLSPAINVLNRNNFGKFIELEIEVQ